MVQTPHDQVQVRVAAVPAIEELAAMPIPRCLGAQLRLGTLPPSGVGMSEPTAVKVRHEGARWWPWGFDGRGGDIIALGKALKSASASIERTTHRCQMHAVQPVGRHARSMNSSGADRGGGHRAGRELSARPHCAYQHPLAALDAGPPRLVVGITIPLVLAVTFLSMWYWGIRAAPGLARLAHHRAGPVGGRRHHRSR